jgi:hypothetical protein
MARKTQHVIPNTSGGWSVKRGGAERASKRFENKTEAEKYATKVSKQEKAELIVHRKDGTIQKAQSYGNDPCPPRDKR